MIGSPLSLASGVTLSNRIAKAAMTEAMCPDGDPSDALIELYRAWGAGSPGMLVTGNAMVDRRYLERMGNIVFDARTDRGRVKRLAEAARAGGSAAYVQLSHPGRQTNVFVHPQPVAPSAVAAVRVLHFFGKPRALSEAEIEEILLRFVGAAELARQSGFDGVQIHAAHGYLISQFLSPLTNQRTDTWGGDAPRRARFLLEAIRRVRAKVGPRFGIAVKLNTSDFQRGGFSQEDSLAVVRLLDGEGIDFLELSGGNYESVALLGYDETGARKPEGREGYFLELATRARKETTVPIMLTGGLRSRAAMDAALASGIDIIGLARPFCVQPDVARSLLASSGATCPAFTIPPLGIAAIEGLAETDWCNAQMRRIAQGKAPDLRRGVKAHTMASLTMDTLGAVARRWRGANQGAPAV